MVLGTAFTQFLNRNNLETTSSKHEPMLNTAITTISGSLVSSSVLSNRKKGLIKWYLEKSSVLTGIVNMIVRDANEKVYFEPIDGKNGRNRIKAAETFFIENSMQNMFFSQLIDSLVTGESYAFVKGLSPKVIEKEVQRFLSKKGLPDNKFTRKLFFKANFPDEDLLTARKIRYVASSTMENVFDHYNILRYVQRVAMNEKHFTPEEIIHVRLMDINGMTTGFTPVTTLITQLQLDEFMWQNMTAIAKNGGQADKIFSAEDIDINSPSFKRIEHELQKYHSVQNRHGSLLLNGKIRVEELSQLDQMQFKEMGLFITGLIALQWGVPRSRLPYIVGGTNTKDDTGGNSEKGYYNNIECLQDTFDSFFNKQLWIPKFKVIMKRKKSYKHDQMVEVQTQQSRLNNLTFMNNELGRVGKVLSPDYVIRYINGINETISEEDLDKKPEESVMDNSMLKQNQESNQSQTDSSDKVNIVNRKRNEANSVAESRGKPSGYGKEEFLQELLEYKEKQVVPLNLFIQLYNEDKHYSKNPPRVFFSEDDGIVRLVYRSTDFVYETVTPKHNLTATKLMNFVKLIMVPKEEMSQELGEVDEEKVLEVSKNKKVIGPEISKVRYSEDD